MKNEQIKFNDIKVGDKVIVTVSVQYGLYHHKYFRIIKPVTKTTPKQFLVGDRRFKKENGCEIGTYSRAYFVGEYPDETTEYLALRSIVHNVKLSEKAVDQLFRNSREIIEKIGKEKSDELYRLSTVINKIISEATK